MTQFSRTLLSALTLTLGLTAAAYAHEGATGVVKERMELMKGIAASMKVLAPMIKGETPWDAAKAGESAAAIADHAKAIPDKFPKGSTGHPSEAKEEIWIKWQQFQFGADMLVRDALALKAAANGGADAAKPSFGRVVKSCKSCHESFRAKKQ